MLIDCTRCGQPTWYTPLLDSINFKVFKLFHCWTCLWDLNKYSILENTKIPEDRWEAITLDDFMIPPTIYT